MQKLVWVIVALLSAVIGGVAYQQSKSDFTTLQGEQYSWRELKGNWVVLNYFAEWCVPCLKEVPELNAFNHAIQGQNIQLFAASFDALSNEELAQIQQKYDMRFALIQSASNVQMPVAKPQQLPATFLISPQGELVKTLLGEQSQGSLFNAIALAKQQTQS